MPASHVVDNDGLASSSILKSSIKSGSVSSMTSISASSTISAATAKTSSSEVGKSSTSTWDSTTNQSAVRQRDGVSSGWTTKDQTTAQSILTAPMTTSVQTTILSTSSGHIITTVVEVENVLPAGSVVTSLTNSSASTSPSHTGTVVGAVLGALAGLLIILGCGLFFFLRSRRRKRNQKYKDPDSGETGTFDGNFDPDRIAEVIGGGGNRGRSGARPPISPRAKRARSRSLGFEKKNLFDDDDKSKQDEFDVVEGGTLPKVSIDLAMDIDTDTETLATWMGYDAPPPQLEVIPGGRGDWILSELKHLMVDHHDSQGGDFTVEREGLAHRDLDHNMGGEIAGTSVTGAIIFPFPQYRSSSPSYAPLSSKDQDYLVNIHCTSARPLFHSVSTSFSSTTTRAPPTPISSPTHANGYVRPLSWYGYESSSSHAYPPLQSYPGYASSRRAPSPSASSVYKAHTRPIYAPTPVPVAGADIRCTASFGAASALGSSSAHGSIPRKNSRPTAHTHTSPGAISAYYGSSSAYNGLPDAGDIELDTRRSRSRSPSAFSSYGGYGYDSGYKRVPAADSTPEVSFGQRVRRASSPGAYSAFAAAAHVERTASGSSSAPLSLRSLSPDSLSVYEVYTAYHARNVYGLPTPVDNLGSGQSRRRSLIALGPATSSRKMNLGMDGDGIGGAVTLASVEGNTSGPLVVTNPDPTSESIEG
ncbi:hypothetical protein BT96DRAFT_973343 [Gymnopus androsaceus JB14]|uniref:REJ domain-containing protein n=1 Tax=Gymnopus androsaceus JB14 TaxID=1447944 RepID=A0A6A4I1B3_9AGAR|nr:hypothetical protein BT96DRAFT_973343 [Gymnopus androsaceus JB14]